VRVSIGSRGGFTGCRFENHSMLELIASGGGTSTTALQCVSKSNASHGFVAKQGARLCLMECTAAKNNIGVLAHGAEASVEWQEGFGQLVLLCHDGQRRWEGDSSCHLVCLAAATV
jgi:hypothetical protein